MSILADDALTLTTARLLLRPWTDADRAPFAALNADPRVMRFFPALQDRAASDAAIDGWQQQLRERGWSNWAVQRIDNGSFIGFVGLSVPRRALPFSPCVEIGWRLAAEHWGQGFATEGASAALDLAFGRLGLDEVVSFTALLNRPSIAVMQRIGMTSHPDEDFDHPGVPEDNPLRRHCLYRRRRIDLGWLGGAR
jgi:RimJ/RimL family protein N-acetyltransferase